MTEYIPADVRRGLRQETNYGCAVCGSPIIDYHHIIPRSEKQHNDPDHMIVLCPNHHRPADDGAIPRSELYELKENPQNERAVDYFFNFKSGRPRFEIGNLHVEVGEGTRHSILKVEDRSLLSISFREDVLTFSMELHDGDGELIAEITENEWSAYTDQVWDVVYKSKKLSVWDPDENLRLRLTYDADEDMIKFEAKFHYQGIDCEILPSKIIANDATVQGDGEIILSKQRSGVLFYTSNQMDGIAMFVH